MYDDTREELKTVDADVLLAVLQHEPDIDTRFKIAQDLFGIDSEWCYLKALTDHPRAQPTSRIVSVAAMAAPYLAEFHYAPDFTESPYKSVPPWMTAKHHVFCGLMRSPSASTDSVQEFVLLGLRHWRTALYSTFGTPSSAYTLRAQFPMMTRVDGTTYGHPWSVFVSGLASLTVERVSTTKVVDEGGVRRMNGALLSVEMPKYDPEVERQNVAAEKVRMQNEFPEFAYAYDWKYDIFPAVLAAVDERYATYRAPQKANVSFVRRTGVVSKITF